MIDLGLLGCIPGAGSLARVGEPISGGCGEKELSERLTATDQEGSEQLRFVRVKYAGFEAEQSVAWQIWLQNQGLTFYQLSCTPTRGFAESVTSSCELLISCWQVTQYLAHGTACRRLAGIGSSQPRQTP